MSAIAERAVEFYLTNPDVVEANGHGQTHRIYSCPACSTPVVLRDGEMVALSSRMGGRSSILSDGSDELSVGELSVSSSSVATASVVNGVASSNAVSACAVGSGSSSNGSSLCSDGDGLQRDSEQLVPC